MLFSNGFTLCFGEASKGQIGRNSGTDLIDPSAAPYIVFSDTNMAIVGVFAGVDNTCVIRCDKKIICFGANDFGQVGQDRTLADHLGDAGTDISSATPIAFDPAKIPITSVPSLSSLTFSSGTAVTMTPGQIFYNACIYGAMTVSVSSFAANPNCAAATLTVNGASPATPIVLRPHGVTLLTVVVATSGSTTYTISLRRIDDTSVTLAANFACLHTNLKIVCWGVSA